MISTEVVVANADGTTIDASANTQAVNIIPSATKPVRSKAMYVLGNGRANSIAGTSKADTLSGNGAYDGADTLTGNAGNDIFLLDGKGDVIISDYSSAKGNYDRVRLGDNVDLTDGVSSGTNLIFTYNHTVKSSSASTSATSNADSVRTYHATLVGAASTKITLVSSDGKAGAQVYGSESIEVANGDGDKVDVGSNPNVQSIDASKRTKNVWLVGNAKTSTVLGGKKNDTIDVQKLETNSTLTGAYIDSGAGADSIYGSAGADVVTLGAGNDTFVTGGGDDTVTTGVGKDIIVYDATNNRSGHLVVADYDGKSDRIELKGFIKDNNTIDQAIAMIDYNIETDSSVILNLGYKTLDANNNTSNYPQSNYSIKLLNAANGKLSITDGQGLTQTLTLTDPYTLFVTNTDGSNISPAVGSAYTNIDASKRTTSVNITGNIKVANIKGGTKADIITTNSTLSGGTITGGKGDDTLGVGSDSVAAVFYAYTSGDGKDVITNYRSDQDVIVFDSAKTTVNETKSKVSGEDYILAIGSGQITFKGAAKKEIKVQAYGESTTKVYNAQTTTTVASTTSTAKAFIESVETELFTDDVIAGSDDLNNIIAPNYQVTTDITSNEFEVNNIKPQVDILSSNKAKK